MQIRDFRRYWQEIDFHLLEEQVDDNCCVWTGITVE